MVGQFKDDCIQDHKHRMYYRNGSGSPGGDPNAYNGSATAGISGRDSGTAIDAATSTPVRKSDTTRGKSKGVKYVIKVL